MQTIPIRLTPRHLIVASPGKVLVAIDFTNQELLVLGVLSDEQKIINAIYAPSSIEEIGENGLKITYPNPWADLHTMTAQMCCYPKLFEGKHEREWVKIAKDESLITDKGSARSRAKTLNFGIVYLQSAEAMSVLNHVSLDEAIRWQVQHQKAYPKCHSWIEEMSHLSSLRGWAITNLKYHRVRWVAEDNSKGAGASPARSGVNHCIQGFCASITKLAALKVAKALGDKGRVIATIHDELLCEVPGKCFVELIKKGDSYVPEVIGHDDEAQHWAEIIKFHTEKAEEECFLGQYPGAASYAIAPWWSH